MIYHSVYWVSGQGALPLYWRDWNRAILSSLPFIVGRASDFQGREQYTHPADMQISVALLPRPIFPWNLSGQTAAGASHWPPACPPHFWIKKSVRVLFCSKTLSGSRWPGSFWTARPPFGISEAWWTLTLGSEGAGGSCTYCLKLSPTVELTYEYISLPWISHLSWPPLASPLFAFHTLLWLYWITCSLPNTSCCFLRFVPLLMLFPVPGMLSHFSYLTSSILVLSWNISPAVFLNTQGRHEHSFSFILKSPVRCFIVL